jgi:hypothetical protein
MSQRAGEFAVDIVGRHRNIGADRLRKLLLERGEDLDLLRFYRLMASLERAGRIEGGFGNTPEMGNMGERIYRIPVGG